MRFDVEKETVRDCQIYLVDSKRGVRKTAESDYQFHHVRPSEWNSSADNGLIFIKFDIQVCLENLPRIFNVY
jgi:hypothetical protein